MLDFSTANRAMLGKSLLRFDEAKMNELYSMSVASTMMDHTKANVFENEVAKELFNLQSLFAIVKT